MHQMQQEQQQLDGNDEPGEIDMDGMGEDDYAEMTEAEYMQLVA